MIRKFILTVFFIALFILGYIFFLKPEAPIEFVRSLDATAERFDRELVPVPGFQTRNLTDTVTVFRPMTLKVIGDHFYVSDFSDFSIHYFDRDGNPVGKLRMGKGRGPGEFLNLTDFDVCGNTFWAVDIQSFMIHAFSMKTGEVLKSFTVEHRPYKIACLSDGFVVQWLGTELLFSKFDNEGNERFRFGEVIENQPRNTLSLGGTLVSNYHDRFVYIPNYASLIYQYQANGELINVLKTPDGIAFPKPLKVNGFIRAPDYDHHRGGWLDAENNLLYVNARLEGEEQNEQGEWTGERQAFIDRYNLVTGEYETSVHLEYGHAPLKIVYTPDAFFSKTPEGELFIYKFTEEVDF